MPYKPLDYPSSADAVSRTLQAHRREMLDRDGIEGIAIGRTAAGDDSIVIYARDDEAATTVPQSLDGYPVEIVLSGPIRAIES